MYILHNETEVCWKCRCLNTDHGHYSLVHFFFFFINICKAYIWLLVQLFVSSSCKLQKQLSILLKQYIVNFTARKYEKQKHLLFELHALHIEASSSSTTWQFLKMDFTNTAEVLALDWLSEFDIIFKNKDMLLTFSESTWLVSLKGPFYDVHYRSQEKAYVLQTSTVFLSGSWTLSYMLKKEISKLDFCY